MGFRFRKSIKVLPGIRLNFSKSGISTSFGGPGASINVSKRGTRRTVGLPGSGVSYSAFTPANNRPAPADVPEKSSKITVGCGWMLAGVLGLALIAQVASHRVPSHDPNLPPASGAALQYENGQTVYVTASALNAREGPSINSNIAASLPTGSQATILDRSGEWLKIVQGGAMLWIAAKHVSNTKPDLPAVQPQALMAPTGLKAKLRREANKSVYFANCAAARAAGAAPVYRGAPGYSRKLDRDGDGIGCE